MVTSKYLEKFTKIAGGENKLPLRGNRVLVELIPMPEMKSSGGLIISSQLNDHRTSTEINRADLAVVLATGAGYYDDATGEDIPLDLKAGAVVLLPRTGLRLYSQFPGIEGYTKETIGVCLETEVTAVWESVASFEAYVAALNS